MNTYLVAIALFIFILPMSFVVQYYFATGRFPKKYASAEYYLNSKVESKLAVSIFFILLAVIPAVKLLISDGVPIPLAWIVLITSLCMTLTSILGWKHFKIGRLYKKYSKFVNFTLAAVALVVSVLVSALVDGLISEITLTEAAVFPVAQKGITIIVSIAVWAFVISAISLAVAVLVGFWAVVSPQVLLSKSKTKYMGEAIKNTIKAGVKVKTFHVIAVLYGLFFSIALIPSLVAKIVSDDEFYIIARELIVFSSFHLPASVCSISSPEHSLIVQVRYQYAVVASPDKDAGYKFSTEKCKIKFGGSNN